MEGLRGNSIYLHRIVVNPEFKGKRHWEILLGNRTRKTKGLAYPHGHWAANPTIINYYKSFGFTLLKITHTDIEELPFTTEIWH